MDELIKHIESHAPTKLHKILRIVLPIIIIVSAVIISGQVAKKKQKPKKQIPKKISLLVETEKLMKKNEKVIIRGMGTVVPAKQVSIYPKISGNIINISPNFIEGKMLSKDEMIVEIDKKDYEIQLQLDAAKLSQANALLEIEKGKQAVAKDEWEILKTHKDFSNENTDTSLALRKPQLNQAMADVESAKVNIEKAKLNLERTIIKMPYDGIILNKFVDLSSLVSTQTKICDVVYANEFYIETFINVEKLKWITFPGSKEEASIANVYIGDETIPAFKGKVIELLKDIESNGRMAKVLISIENPINVNAITKSMLLNSYVNVEIEGKILENVYKIPREVLRENNTIWEVDEQDKLKIETVDVIFKDKYEVYIESNQKFIELIITDLTLPISGMPISRFEKFSSNEEKALQDEA